MKQLKFEPVNGYGVLVDENIECPEDSRVWNISLKTNMVFRGYRKDFGHNADTTVRQIIFAEKELNLEGVPVFEWRDFEVEKLAKKSLPDDTDWQKRIAFVQVYKSNPAKYTEEDLRKAMDYASQITNNRLKYIDDYVKSLQKYPKYVVMESEIVSLLPTGSHIIKKEDVSKTFKTDLKLFTNSEGKQEGIVKELIWE